MIRIENDLKEKRVQAQDIDWAKYQKLKIDAETLFKQSVSIKKWMVY